MSPDPAWMICPTLGVRDVRAAAAYFAERLGFEILSVFEGSPEEGPVYGIVRRGGAEVHLQIRRRALRAAPRETMEADAYVRVPDADALHQELVGRGAEILRAPEDEPYGMRDFTVAGPEGLRLNFGSPLTALR